jgi:hypothetical protein
MCGVVSVVLVLGPPPRAYIHVYTFATHRITVMIFMQLRPCFKQACPRPVDCEVSDWIPMTPCYDKVSGLQVQPVQPVQTMF